MNNKEIELKVQEAIVNVLGIKKEEIDKEKRLIEDLGIDSFSALELVFELEDVLDMEISTEEAKGFETVDDVHKYVHHILTVRKGVKAC